MSTSVRETQLSFAETLILDGLKGKSDALHSYDRMIWVVRTGFITLFFAGWGFLGRTLLEGRAGVSAFPTALVIAMGVASLGLAIAGLLIDMNYCRSKSQIVASYNAIVTAVAPGSGPLASSISEHLKIAGAYGGKDDEAGYVRELINGICVYTIPLVALAIALGIVKALTA